MTAPLPIVLILGPTAAGKTELAIELARRLPGECISADSMQVYRGMDVGTAKPTPAQRAEVPHHLLDLVEPDHDGFSVDEWLRAAEQAISQIRERGRHPIVVGGTNLYVMALLDGLFDGPPPDESLRRRLRRLDRDELRRRLEAADPAAAARIHPNDRKRTMRAIEVHELTGRRISDLQTQWLAGEPRRDVRIIGLRYGVEAINRRINARVGEMMRAGLVDEVTRLLERGGLGRQASEALGYAQVIEHLRGAATLEEAVEQIKIRTRRLAKQQRTWLRRFAAHPGSTWLDAEGETTARLAEMAMEAVLAPPKTRFSASAGWVAAEGVSERLS